MRIFRLLVPVLVLALAVPVASAVAGSDGTPAVTVAKKKKKKAKKKTWCEKAIAKRVKTNSFKRYKYAYKRVKVIKSQKASLYVERMNKRLTGDYVLCSEAPRFSTSLDFNVPRPKLKEFRAVKNNCAVAYADINGKAHTHLNLISYKFFRKGMVPQIHPMTLGRDGDIVLMKKLVLTKNCVVGFIYTSNGNPMLGVTGLGEFAYTGQVTRNLSGMTPDELKSLKVTATSKTSAKLTWTQKGEQKSLDITADGVR